MKRIVSENTLTFLNDSGNIVAELIEEKKEDDVWLVYLKGSVGNDCAYDIADELFALISVDAGIILDMSDTDYVSDTFADLLIQLQIRLEKTDYESLPIQNMPKAVYQSLKDHSYITSLDYELKEE